MNDERLCSTDGNVANDKVSSNGYATSYLGKRVLGYGVISCCREPIAQQRITRCLEIQHRIVATRIARIGDKVCRDSDARLAIVDGPNLENRKRLDYVFAIDEWGGDENLRSDYWFLALESSSLKITA